ncbi:MAG: hypothetical protein HYT98_03845 [Candidatus Sungbacteria bacterium]|nr:hypothetical protein [Candidatus Sungbacteria bacterium]
MITKQILVLGIGVVAVIAVIFFIFMPFFRDGNEEGRNLGTLPRTGERSGVGSLPRMTPTTSLPIDALKPLPDIIPLTTPSVMPRGEAGSSLLEIGEIKPPSGVISGPEAVLKIQDIYQRIQKSVGSIPPGEGKLTEKQIFDILWRPEYIQELRKLEGVEIRNGIMTGLIPVTASPTDSNIAEISESELSKINWYIPPIMRSSLQTDDDIFKSLKNLLGVFRQNGWINDKDYPIYQKALDETLPQIIKEERKNLQSGLPQSRILPGQQQIIVGGNPMVLSDNILSGLKFVLGSAEPANAAWFTGPPDCYKDDEPALPIPGPSVPAFFCNAGIEFSWAVYKGKWYCLPSFNPDCGPHDIDCIIGACAPPVGLGCLNSLANCKVWPQAVWDAPYALPPQTLMCGCG